MKTVTCDSCQKQFIPSIVTTCISGGGEHWYFTCPHCGHHYDICHISRQGIELRRQLDSLKAQLRLAPHNDALAVQRDALTARLAAEITDLASTKRPKPESPSSA